jgi:hypothetical protein
VQAEEGYNVHHVFLDFNVEEGTMSGGREGIEELGYVLAGFGSVHRKGRKGTNFFGE